MANTDYNAQGRLNEHVEEIKRLQAQVDILTEYLKIALDEPHRRAMMHKLQDTGHRHKLRKVEYGG